MITKSKDKYELHKVPNIFLDFTTLRDIMKDKES